MMYLNTGANYPKEQHATFKSNIGTNYPKGNMLYLRVTLGLTIQSQYAVFNGNTGTNYPRATCCIQCLHLD